MTRNGAVARVLGRTAVVILVATYGLTMASAGSASASRAPAATESARDMWPGPAESVNAAEITAVAEATAAATATGDASAAASSATQHAWTWVRSMLRTATPITSDSAISPEREYPMDWTGPVSGTFTVDGVTPPPVTTAAVVLDTASSIAASSPDYRGPVSGQVTVPAQPNRWIIQVYRELDGQRIQVPLQTLVRPDGTFDVDLRAVTDPGAGNWQFGVLDAQAGYAPVGLPWPSVGTYNGWEVRTFATTDRRYPIDSQPAAADGTFTFPRTAPGTKTFQLVKTTPSGQDKVLAEHAPGHRPGSFVPVRARRQ